ncbi:hypothetical protein AAG570_002543 [Ranatra chinensis]|uniref:Uncharacterized protein n=1 Tax=Ranatra chinensis TaxID=642074 RepID=A0ABD0YQK5_9HEMI
MASKRRNMFHKNKTQETTEEGRPEEVDPSSPLSSYVTPQNWQPPAPIFPHMGQLLSTPIGPPVNQNTTHVSLPVYSGFSNTVPKSDISSAQFFYQDLGPLHMLVISPNKAVHELMFNYTITATFGGSSLLFAPGFMEGPTLPQLPVLSPPEPPS